MPYDLINIKKSIRINKSAHFGVIVSALEVVQPRLGIVVISAVSEGGDVGQGAGGGENIAPGVVGVGSVDRTGGVDDLQDIALQVSDVEVPGAARIGRKRKAHGTAVGVVSIAVVPAVDVVGQFAL